MIPIPPAAAKWAASLTGKLVIWAVIIGVVAFAGYKVYNAIFERGVAQERAVWVAAQEKADKEQKAREDAQEQDAKATGDASRAEGVEQRAATTAATTKTSEAIQREYQSKPESSVSCKPDGRPADIPVRVQDELRKAQRAAEAAGR